MQKTKILILLFIAIAVLAFFYFDLGALLSLESLKERQVDLEVFRSENPIRTAGIYFLVYVIVTALSLPGAAIMTLAGGAIFGFGWGTLLVSFASSVGATLAFIIARLLLRDWVQNRFGDKMATINQGIEKDGAFYLFTLRLVPVFPFFVINLLMALTPIKTWTFYWVSQLGMFAATLVFVNAGTQLAHIDSLSGILSPGLLGSFVLLGVFPLIAKKVVSMLQHRKVYEGWKKPSRFDHNMVVIGAGSGGLVTAYIAAAVKADVTLIEKHKMGGDCLNTGCVPSKALLRSAKFLDHQRRSSEFGIKKAVAEFDFSDVMERVQRIIKAIEPHDSIERYTGLGVNIIEGEGKIISPWEVEVQTENGSQTLTTRSIVIATGARPFIPPVPGIDEMDYFTSDNIWELRENPGRLLVLGGGPIGCELAQAFNRLGAEVTQVEMMPRLLGREDPEVSEAVISRFEKEGVRVLVEHKAIRFLKEGPQKILIAEHYGAEVRIEFDALLCAVGRAPNVSGIGLEEMGIETTARGSIETNEFLQTRFPNILAVGDVVGPFQFTHTASHQAWFAAVNGLFGFIKRFKADYRVIPHTTFTEPEVARVGLNEAEAKAQNISYELTTYNLDDLDRAIADSEAEGLVKVLTVPGKDKILGVTIVGEHSGDLIAEFVLAMKHGLGLNKILGTIHIYPTFAEANKYVAGNWKRAHAPEKILQWVARFHQWRRG